MSYLKELESLNIAQLWCGKASAYEVLIALLYAIEKDGHDISKFPKYESLLELKDFMESDKSHRYYSRMKDFQAPQGTEKIPLERVNLSLLVKLIVHRIDDVCIKYFQSSTSSEWVPRNSYGDKVLGYWKIFDSKYPSDVTEFMKNSKPTKSTTEVIPTENKIEGLKTILTKVQGAWAQKVSEKIQTLETAKIEQVTKVSEAAEVTEAVEPVKEKVQKQMKPKKTIKPESKTTTPVDDGQGEWTKVGTTRKVKAVKNKDKYKPKNTTK